MFAANFKNKAVEAAPEFPDWVLEEDFNEKMQSDGEASYAEEEAGLFADLNRETPSNRRRGERSARGSVKEKGRESSAEAVEESEGTFNEHSAGEEEGNEEEWDDHTDIEMEPNPQRKAKPSLEIPPQPPSLPKEPIPHQSPQPSTPKAQTPIEPSLTKTPPQPPSPHDNPPNPTLDNHPTPDNPKDQAEPEIAVAAKEAVPEPTVAAATAAASAAEEAIPKPPAMQGRKMKTKVVAKERKLRKLLVEDEERGELGAEEEVLVANQRVDAAAKAEAERIAAARAVTPQIYPAFLK